MHHWAMLSRSSNLPPRSVQIPAAPPPQQPEGEVVAAPVRAEEVNQRCAMPPNQREHAARCRMKSQMKPKYHMLSNNSWVTPLATAALLSLQQALLWADASTCHDLYEQHGWVDRQIRPLICQHRYCRRQRRRGHLGLPLCGWYRCCQQRPHTHDLADNPDRTAWHKVRSAVCISGTRAACTCRTQRPALPPLRTVDILQVG